MIGIQIWERRDKETAKAFAAFVAYRDQPPMDRTIPAAANATGGSTQQFTRWSRQHDWVVRATSYDDFLDLIKRDKGESLIKEMADRQAEAAGKLQDVALESLTRIAEFMKADPSRRLSENSIMQFLTQGAKMERVARGEPDSIGEHIIGPIEVEWNGPPDYSKDAADAPGPVERPPE